MSTAPQGGESPSSHGNATGRQDGALRYNIPQPRYPFPSDDRKPPAEPSHRSAPLFKLPIELLWMVGQRLSHTASLSSLSRVNRHARDVFARLLYRRDAQQSRSSALLWAAKHGQRSTAEQSLQGGGDINVVDDEVTPLYLAAKNSHVELVRLLLEHGADPNFKGSSNWTPLFEAAANGDEDIVRLMIQRGADINLKDTLDRTPMFYASKGPKGKNQAVVRLLLEHGADPNSKEKAHWYTPLFIPAMLGDVPVVRMLLEHEADPNSQDENNQTPLFHARKWGQEEVVQILLEYNANPVDYCEVASPTPVGRG